MNSKDAKYTFFLLAVIIAFSVIVVVCGFWYENGYFLFQPGEKGVRSDGNSYPQDFKTETGTVIKEISGKIELKASAFIVDKQKGWFATAAHFVGFDGKNNSKLFYNGQVYQILPLKVSSRADVAIIKIAEGFNAGNFAEPYKFAFGTFAGEKVSVRGFHVHPSNLWKDKRLTGILRQYYNASGHEEIVFDDLAAFVMRTDARINLPATPDRISASDLSAKSCIELRTEEDHRCSFGGLSGAPIVNAKNELVGIVFASDPNSGYFLDLKKHKLIYVSSEVLYAVPAQELKNLKISWSLFD